MAAPSRPVVSLRGVPALGKSHCGAPEHLLRQRHQRRHPAIQLDERRQVVRRAGRVGNIGVGAAVLIGHDIVFIAGDVFGTHVESILDSASGPPASTARLTPTQAVDVGIGDESGALLAGYDTLTSDYTTYVDHAAAGANFNAATSYHKVATFKHEQLLGVSGDAVLTRQTTGKEAALLRFCNSKGCGLAHRVPGPNNAGPNAFGVFQNPNGVTHVFSSGTYVGPLYDLMDLSTSNGTRWSMLNAGNGINSTTFTGALDNFGAGLVLGSTPAWGYPVLVPQAVSFKLKSSKISSGHSTSGSGHVSPAFLGLAVTLEVERSGLWHTVATTHESSSGSFSFKIKGSHTGTFRYRAVASDRVGEFLYGYSRDRSLTVTK